MQKLFSEEYEKAILGCMLLNNSIIDDVQSILQKAYFQFGKYAAIYEVLCNLYNANNSVDIVMLSQSLPKLTTDIATLTDIGSAANYEFYAKRIKDLYTSREFKRTLSEKLEKLDDKNIDEMLYETDDFLNKCMTSIDRLEPVNAKNMSMSIIEDIQNSLQRHGALEGLDTGIEKLNEYMDGLHVGNLVTIGARPSIGKSAFTDQLNMNLATRGIKTCMFSLEMNQREIGRRRASFMSGVPINHIKSGLLNPAQIQKVNTAAQKIFDSDSLLYDSATIGFDFNEIVGRIRLHAKQGYQVFFIDHIGLLEYSDGTMMKDFEKISQMTKRLKKLAETLKVVIVIVCQLTRDTEGKEPQLNSLRGSGSIEQDSNIVMFIHRERQADPSEICIPAKLILAKDRDGSCGEVNFSFYPGTTQFRELDENGNALLPGTMKQQTATAPNVGSDMGSDISTDEYYSEGTIF